jgi:hypothetical protein
VGKWGCWILVVPIVFPQSSQDVFHVPDVFPSPKEEITTYIFWECPKLDYFCGDRPIKKCPSQFYFLFLTFKVLTTS